MMKSILSCVLLVVLSCVVGGVDAEEVKGVKGKPLAKWREYVYGLSFSVPEGMKALAEPVEGERCRFTDGKMSFSFSVIKTVRDLDRDGEKGDGFEKTRSLGSGGRIRQKRFVGAVLGNDKTSISDVEKAIRIEISASAAGAKNLFYDDRVTIAGRQIVWLFMWRYLVW